jgi:signal peptidase complex subunit 3
MYSSLQRLNQLTSLATTYLMILMGLISIASFLSLPTVDPGRIDVKDLIMRVSFKTVISPKADV